MPIYICENEPIHIECTAIMCAYIHMHTCMHGFDCINRLQDFTGYGSGPRVRGATWCKMRLSDYLEDDGTYN